MGVEKNESLVMAKSYNSNSTTQLAIIQSSIPFIKLAIDTLDIIPSSFPIVIVDFGSSHGVNSMYAMETIVDYIRTSKKTERSFLVIHNDLPANDWTQIFNILNEKKIYFGLANGRSFYEQCLPSNLVTVSYSSTSLHWLSRKPCNISNHCLSFFAQGEERAAFESQAKNDYSQFLQNRSHELVQGGVLILSILAVDKEENNPLKNAGDLLYKCAKLLLLNEEELLEYTFPFHIRSYKEYIDEEVFKQCSLQLMKSDFCYTQPKFYDEFQEGKITVEQFAQKHAGFIRGWAESLFKILLQRNKTRSEEDVNELSDRFWSIFYEQIMENPKEHNSSTSEIHLVFKKV